VKRSPFADLLTYREAANALAHPSTVAIGHLIALGLLEAVPTPFGLAVTRVSVEQLRRLRRARPGSLVSENRARHRLGVPDASGTGHRET
jgi:hypothetical protein